MARFNTCSTVNWGGEGEDEDEDADDIDGADGKDEAVPWL